MNFNDLPSSLMTKIMNINKNQERQEHIDREHKLNHIASGYAPCMNHIKLINRLYLNEQEIRGQATDNQSFKDWISWGFCNSDGTHDDGAGGGLLNQDILYDYLDNLPWYLSDTTFRDDWRINFRGFEAPVQHL